jgi:glycosyltransferase involved in cell wall biosynthesis
MTKDTERVFVGLPCYNRPEGLARTIECLQGQTHTNWTALISDNASPNGDVEAVARRACAEDSRFRYHRQPRNNGSEANFKFVAESADCPFFMWAADDDLFEPRLMATCLGLLARVPAAAMAFGTAININRHDAVVRTFGGFARFASGRSRYFDAWRYLREPEIMGKANLVHGLFRTDALKRSIREFWDKAGFGQWGGDMALMYGFICRYPIVGTDEVLLRKRIDTDEQAGEAVLREHPRTYFVPDDLYASYLARQVAVAPSPAFARIARAGVELRRIESVKLRKWTERLRRWRLAARPS